MHDREPLDFNSPGDALFEVRLRHAAPAANSIAIEDMLYRAGYETAMTQRVDGKKRWSGFALGACSGALAAGLIWFCSVLPFFSRPTAIAPEMATNASVPVVLEEPTEGASAKPLAARVGKVKTMPVNPFLRREGSDPYRDSLSQVAKRQWDQRRLFERTQWVSSRASSNSSVESEANDFESPNSLWQIRNGNVPAFGL